MELNKTYYTLRVRENGELLEPRIGYGRMDGNLFHSKKHAVEFLKNYFHRENYDNDKEWLDNYPYIKEMVICKIKLNYCCPVSGKFKHKDL